jgi:hypothetical protein
VEAELIAASNRESRIKAKLDETRAKLRNNEAERQREISQAGASSTTVFATERSNSPPLRLNLVINCKCQTDDAFATRPSSGSTRSESPRAAKALTARRARRASLKGAEARGQLPSPQNARGPAHVARGASPGATTTLSATARGRSPADSKEATLRAGDTLREGTLRGSTWRDGTLRDGLT